MAQIERKYMAHYINCAMVGETAVYERLGKDLEEYNVEMGATSETKQNILGEKSVKITGYEKQGTIEPYYADKDEALFTRLQDIIDNELVLDDLTSDIVDVHLWKTAGENSTTFEAIKWIGKIEVSSYGGDYNGYQIPFNFHYEKTGIKGTFDTSTKTFTPTSV